MEKHVHNTPPPKRPPERRIALLTLLNPWNFTYEIYRLDAKGMQCIRVLPGVMRTPLNTDNHCA